MHVRQGLRTLLTATVATVSVAALMVSPVSSASADTRSEKEKADRAVSELKQEVAESSAKLAAAEEALVAAEAQMTEAKAALGQAQGQVAAARAREAELSRKLEAAKVAEQQAEQALSVLNGQVAESQEQLGALVRQAYQTGPVPELALALDANSFQEYASQRAYLEQMSSTQNAIVEELRARRAAAASQEEVLAERRAEAAEFQAAAAAQVEERAAAEEAAQAAGARVGEIVDEREAAVEAAQREREEDLRQYEAMRAEAKRLEELIAAEIAREKADRERTSGGGEEQPASSSGTSLLRPVNANVTSSFGWRVHPISGVRKLHTGTDFGAPTGTPVRAAAGGKVIQSEYNSGGYGNRIVVSHGYISGTHLTTTYNHLSSRGVSVGEQVDRGKVIGRVGSTGYSTGPHLHFEVLVNGEFRNPMDWL